MSGNNDFSDILLMQTMMSSNQGGRQGGLDDILRMQAMQQATSGDPTQRQMAMNTMMTANMLSSMEQEEVDRRRREEEEAARRRHEAELRRQQEELRRQQEAIARQQQFDNLMEQGDSFAKANQYELAAERFDQALALFSNNVMAKFNRAVCWEKLGNIKDAYDEFLALTGHTSEVPDLMGHISRCEDGLVEFCNKLQADAQAACDHQDFNAAKECLRKINIFAPTRIKQGTELQQFAHELLDHIEWKSQQDKIMHKFAEAASLLQEVQYELALQRLNSCKEAFVKYSRFLTPEQQAANKAIPSLIASATRGVEMKKHFVLQLQINDLKGKLNTAVQGFAYEAAVDISASMLEKCRLITVPQDVVQHGYIADELILQDYTTLVNLYAGFKKRKKEIPVQQANTIINGLATKGFELLQTDSEAIHGTTVTVLKTRWAELDQRDIQPIMDSIAEVAPRYLGVNNYLIACCYGTHYLQDAQAFRQSIDAIVANNIPRDVRAKIKLAMFNTDLLVQPNPVMFSSSAGSAISSYPIAMAVPLDPVQEKVPGVELVAPPIDRFGEQQSSLGVHNKLSL